jgi:hypothetical protein
MNEAAAHSAFGHLAPEPWREQQWIDLIFGAAASVPTKGKRKPNADEQAGDLEEDARRSQ